VHELSETLQSRVEMLLARAVLERSLASPEKLRQALAEQSRSVARGRKRPRALGAILVELGILQANDMAALQRELVERVLREEEEEREDALLARLLVSKGKARPEDVSACMGVRDECSQGDADGVPRLGELLVLEGLVPEAVVERGLDLVRRSVLTCVSCGLKSPSPALERCSACGGGLEPRAPGEDEWPEEEKAPPREDEAVEPEVLDDRPVQTLGKYKLLRCVGRGGMGIVYEAVDSQLNRRVALKLMLASAHADEEESSVDAERFVREAQLSAKLPRHPHIVTVYEAGVLEGRHFIAMEFIDGVSMSAWAKKGSVTLRQQVRLLRDVALAVHHAHQEGVLHRDLKPLNVLVDAKSQPFVTDFGLAKQSGKDVSASLTLSGRVVGTPSYMSPEQALGDRKVDRRSDVYALGAMLYEILTGRPPFRGESPIEILTKVLKDKVTPPSEMARALGGPAVDRALEGVCMKALARPQGDRYPSAQAFADDLGRWLKGREVKTARVPLLLGKRPPRWVWAAAAGVVVAVAAATGLASMRPSVKRELAQAERLVAEGAFDEADAAYAAALAKDPGNALAVAGRRHVQARRDHARVTRAALALERAQKRAEELRARVQDLEKAEHRATSDEARLRRAAERREAEEEALRAEEAARRAREELLRITASVDGSRP
jgi:serine/threonine protein kinase